MSLENITLMGLLHSADWTHGPAGFTTINVRKRAIVKYKIYNDDSNKHPSMTGLTQKFQLQ